ncbi:MAG TPA: holo-ACP synthase [Candidatus Azoamicus sp. MARI]
MIINIGIDIIEKIRIKKNIFKYKKKFIKKILSLDEKIQYIIKKKKIEFLSKTFTTKECLSKAISTGFRDKIQFKNIKIRNTELKKPYIKIKNIKTYITVSHEKNLTITMLIILKQ